MKQAAPQPLERDCLPPCTIQSTHTCANPRHALAFMVIPGKLVSMKNRKIRTRHGDVKNSEVRAYERDFSMCLPWNCRGLRLGSLVAPLAATIKVFYPSRRSDLDCALVYDCLQAAGVIANDRFIIEKHEFARIDKTNPRVEIELRRIEL